MSKQPVPLEQLEVIGYAEVLPEGKGPAVVPPVFRDHPDPSRCFVPPFRIAENWLINPQCVSFTEVQHLANAESLTLFKGAPLPAQAGHKLWVDVNSGVHYEPGSTANRHLQAIYEQRLDAATAALRQGRIDEAEEEAGIALAADETKLESDALLAACHALRGEQKEVLFLKDASEKDGHRAETFALHLQNYLELVPLQTWRALSRGAVDAACRVAGVEMRQRFEVPAALLPFLSPVLHDASILRAGSSFEVRCAEPDAAFLAEFVGLFTHNDLANHLARWGAGVTVDVVRNAYRATKAPGSASRPQGSLVDGYFSRLGKVLAAMGVLWPSDASS
jgi:hypothetical protein